MSPRAALTKHLLDGDDSILTGKFDKPVDLPPDTPVTKPETASGVTPFDADAT
ncbi:MAG TPA: Sec-independent protein translocase TatB, partial [Mycobacterium sp.]